MTSNHCCVNHWPPLPGPQGPRLKKVAVKLMDSFFPFFLFTSLCVVMHISMHVKYFHPKIFSMGSGVLEGHLSPSMATTSTHSKTCLMNKAQTTKGKKKHRGANNQLRQLGRSLHSVFSDEPLPADGESASNCPANFLKRFQNSQRFSYDNEILQSSSTSL